MGGPCAQPDGPRLVVSVRFSLAATAMAEHHRVLLVRLPCNPIFPVGPIYLADHLHKQFPEMPQRILDLAAVPVLDVERVLGQVVDAFRPSLLVFSWRDIQIYAPVDGRSGNPLQHSFEVFYARNPFKRLRGALGAGADGGFLRRALAQPAPGEAGRQARPALPAPGPGRDWRWSGECVL